MLLPPLRPSGPGWVKLPLPLWLECDHPHEFWQHDNGICAVSVFDMLLDASGICQHVMCNVVLSMLGTRPCTEAETQWALNEFHLLEIPPTLH